MSCYLPSHRLVLLVCLEVELGLCLEGRTSLSFYKYLKLDFRGLFPELGRQIKFWVKSTGV